MGVMGGDLTIDYLTDIKTAFAYVDPKLFNRLKDDFATEVSDLFGRGINLQVLKEGKIIALISFNTFGSGCWVIHPKIKERHMIYAERACRLAIEFVQKNACCTRILAIIPENFKPNIRMAEKCGFKCDGIIPNSFKKNDKLYNQYIYSVGD